MGRDRTPKVEPQDAWRLGMSVAAEPQSGVVVSLPGRLDAEALQVAVDALLTVEPVLACRYRDDGKPRFEPADDAGAVAAPVVTESARPMADALHLAAQLIDPDAGPLLATAILRGPDSDVLAMRVHHLASDPYGARELAHRLAEAYTAAAAGSPPAPLPARSRGTFQVLRRVWPHRSVLAAYSENPGAPEWGLATSAEHGSRGYAVGQVDAAGLEAFAAARDTTLDAVVVTALFRALAEVLDAPVGCTLPLNVGVDLRRYIRSGVAACAACNLSGYESLRLARDPSASFEDVLAAVGPALASLEGVRAGLRVAVLVELAARMGPAVLARATAEPYVRDREHDRATPLVADLGVLDADRLRFGALAPDAAFVLPPAGLPPFVGVGFSRFRDALTLAAGGPLLAVGRDARAVVERATAELREATGRDCLRTHGGTRPAAVDLEG